MRCDGHWEIETVDQRLEISEWIIDRRERLATRVDAVPSTFKEKRNTQASRAFGS